MCAHAPRLGCGGRSVLSGGAWKIKRGASGGAALTGVPGPRVAATPRGGPRRRPSVRPSHNGGARPSLRRSGHPPGASAAGSAGCRPRLRGPGRWGRPSSRAGRRGPAGGALGRAGSSRAGSGSGIGPGRAGQPLPASPGSARVSWRRPGPRRWPRRAPSSWTAPRAVSTRTAAGGGDGAAPRRARLHAGPGARARPLARFVLPGAPVRGRAVRVLGGRGAHRHASAGHMGARGGCVWGGEEGGAARRFHAGRVPRPAAR